MALSPLGAALQFQQPITPPPQSTVAPTDVVASYRDANNQAMLRYQAQLQQQNALWGGLAGLGGAGIISLPKLLALKGPAASGGQVLADGSIAAPGAAPADLLGTEAAWGAGLPADIGAATGVGTGIADAGAGIGADAALAGAADAGGMSLADLLPFLLLA